MPSFFYMKLNFPFYAVPLALYNLKKKDLSTFIHEYIHFLQDISSYSLLNNAYVYSEYIHVATNCIYKLPKGEFNIPISIPTNYCNIDLNKYINSNCMGDFSDRDSMFIKGIRFEHYTVPYKNKIVNGFDVPFLVLVGGSELKFGTCAIMESMAFLIERKITRGSSSPKEYPYLAASNVADFLYKEFAEDELNIIALCDMSLQYNNPGKIFVKTLQKMNLEKYLPSKAEDIYDYMYAIPVEQMGEETTFSMGLIKLGMCVQDRLKLYLNDSVFSDFHYTIRNLLGFGLESRLRNPHFMIDIVRDGYALYNNTLKNIMKCIGSPIIIDSLNNYSQIPPAGMPLNPSLQLFSAIEQLYKCFNQGSSICEMYDFCEYTRNNAKELFGNEWQNKVPLMDDNCWKSPWKKISDLRLCPYATLWKHWNLEKWVPKEM